MTTVRTIALFSKPNCPISWGFLSEVAAWGTRLGMKCITGPDYGGWDGNNWGKELIDQAKNEADIAIAIGGDGTLLGMARALFESGIPVLGVNKGTLGYLTEVSAQNITGMLNALLAGEYTIEQRILLKAKIEGSNEEELAFNDVVFTSLGRLASYDVYVDGQSAFSLRADGLIISTPTGSTAYSLAANGPILHPSLKAVALVPNNPHSLSARPMTLPSSSRIDVVVRGASESRLDCDGKSRETPLTDGTRVTVTEALTTVPMVHLKDYNIFNTLRSKLQWAEPRQLFDE